MWSSYITLSFMSNFRNMWHHFTWCFKENLDYCGFLKRLGNLYYSCTNDQIKIFFKSKFWLNIKPRLRTRKRNSIEQAYAKQNRENNALHCFEWQRIGRNPNTTGDKINIKYIRQHPVWKSQPGSEVSENIQRGFRLRMSHTLCNRKPWNISLGC